jgi:hypothetical protein
MKPWKFILQITNGEKAIVHHISNIYRFIFVLTINKATNTLNNYSHINQYFGYKKMEQIYKNIEQ